MQLGICRIEQDEPVLGEDARVKLGEGVGERLAFHVALAQVIGRERVAQQLGGLRDEFVGSFRETNVRDRSARSSGSVGLEGHKLKVVGQKQRLVDFVEVVIFGGEPEHRHAIDARLLHLLGERQRRRDLEQRHQRPAEQSHLLAGDHGESAFAQPLNVAQRRLRRSPGAVLLLQRVGDARLPFAILRHRFGERGDVLCVRRCREELANRGRIGKEVAEDAGGVRNGVERDAVGDHESLSGQQHRQEHIMRFVIRTRYETNRRVRRFG